jgi:hypothetical protein
MSKYIFTLTATLLVILLFVYSHCYSNECVIPKKNVTLHWRPSDAKPLPGQWILVQVGCNESCIGYILHYYEDSLDGMIEMAGGYHFVVPQQPCP